MSEHLASEQVVCSRHKIGSSWSECDRCHGDGEIETEPDIVGDDATFMVCPSCAGTGEVEYCELCYEEECCDT